MVLSFFFSKDKGKNPIKHNTIQFSSHMHANIKQVFLLGYITEINWETKPSVRESV